MRIFKTYNTKFQCDWFHCEINNEHYSSPHRENVEAWRDDKLINADYYKELAKLRKCMKIFKRTQKIVYLLVE